MKKLLVIFTACLSVGLHAQASLNMQKIGQLSYSPKLNDVWGYVDQNGNEFALVGAQSGFSIVNVSNPANPVEELFIPGGYSTWRDIKTYSHYAYVIHDALDWNSPTGSDGIMIVDLSTINSANPTVINFFPTATINGVSHTYTRSHNIYIDENGVLYVFGAGSQNGYFGAGGALMFDLTIDPENPTYLGAFNQNYLHDGMVRGDTLWGGAINDGLLLAVDVSNKSNPVILGSKTTPNAFTHNAWISDDNQTVFTTDEKTSAYVTAYDVSDPSNITELDRIRTSFGNNVIPHNTHVYGDFLVTSYYTSGVQIVDATVPHALLETAYYDTSPLSGTGYEGNWGAYPYLPSGNILATDGQEGLFILSTDYPRGSYLSGEVIDSLTGNPIPNAQVVILGLSHSLTTDVFGEFSTAILDSNTYQVVTSRPGYTNDTALVLLSPGVHTSHHVALLPFGFSIGENQLNEFNVSPNPSQSYFDIDLPEGFGGKSVLRIVDMKGAEVLNKTYHINGSAMRINHQLDNGAFMIYLQNEAEVLKPVRLIVK